MVKSLVHLGMVSPCTFVHGLAFFRLKNRYVKERRTLVINQPANFTACKFISTPLSCHYLTASLMLCSACLLYISSANFLKSRSALLCLLLRVFSCYFLLVLSAFALNLISCYCWKAYTFSTLSMYCALWCSSVCGAKISSHINKRT